MHVDLRMNPYLFGSLLLLGVWLLVGACIYRWSRQDVSEFWWGSFACSLLGFSEPLYVPEYWTPPSVLSFHRWDFESFLFCFSVGGIAAVLPEIPGARRMFFALDGLLWAVLRRVTRPFRSVTRPVTTDDPDRLWEYSPLRFSKHELRQENTLLLAIFLGVFGFTAHLNLNVIFDTSLACVAMAVYLGWRSPRHRWQIAAGGFSFTALYAGVIFFVGRIYPDFFVDSWRPEIYAGKRFLGAPAEEFLFAFTLGIFRAPLCEVWKDERTYRAFAAAGPAAQSGV